jgi:hypothetical protein
MKCIIAGGRDYIPTPSDRELAIMFIKHYKIDKIVSGNYGASDLFGERLAKELKLKLTLFPADWQKYGPKAGPLRNRQMAEYTDCAILFPGGKGTDSMRKEMLIHGKKILYDAEEE